MIHPGTELKQPNRLTYEKAGHQRKEQGQITMWRYALEMKAPRLTRQAIHKQNPENAQVGKANRIQ